MIKTEKNNEALQPILTAKIYACPVCKVIKLRNIGHDLLRCTVCGYFIKKGDITVER